MKKNYLKVMAMLFAAIVSVSFISCGGDDNNEDPSNPETPITPVEPTTNDAMSPTEQKEFLESVALEFMNMTPASDFRDIADLGKYISDTYGDDYDWDRVEDWAEDIFDAAREAVGTNSVESETDSWGNYLYEYNRIYTNYKALILASNFKGHFTARNGRWTLENADDLQFIFNDNRGQQCVLKVETGGSVKKIHAFDLDDRTGYDFNEFGYTYISNEYYDRTQYTIGVPENIVVTLTQGGSLVVKTTVNIDLNNIVDEEFDISRGNVSVSTVTELNNGYKFNVSNVTYTANTKASVSFTMSKNGTTMITIGVAGDVMDIPSVNISAFSAKDFDEDDYNFDDATAKNTYAKVDILGKVQIQGTVTDVRKYINYLEKADDNNRDELTFKSYINQANSLTDVNLFYNGNNVKQAEIKLEPFAEERWDGRTKWEAEPVIYFFDGSSYSTFSAFFNEEDFRNTIDAFKSLANKYAELIDEHIDW